MSKKRLFESHEEYERRMAQEELEAKAGIKKGIFESNEKFQERAQEAYLKRESGLKRGFFESDQHYKERAETRILEEESGVKKRRFESDESFQRRARSEAYEKMADVHHFHMAKPSLHHDEYNRIEALERMTGLTRQAYEGEEAYIIRLEVAALAEIAGIQQGMFESDHEFEHRARKEALKKDPGRVEFLGL